MCIGCSSTHPITEAPYINLEQGVDGVRLNGFPTAIVDSLGWNDLPSASATKFGEEFQIAIQSDQKPYHLFRISSARKDPGQTILFWPKPEMDQVTSPNENMKDFLQGMCEDYLEAGNYEYCIPQFSRDVNWGTYFSNMVNQNIWSMEDEASFEMSSDSTVSDWKMVFQIRSGMNFRTFRHTNPDGYQYSGESVNVLAIAAQLRQIANNFTPAKNYDVYRGITSGEKGSTFQPCGLNEQWRFDGEISALITESGLPIQVQDQENLRFLVKVEGSIRDEWYAQRNSTGVTKIITPVHVNSISVTSARSCSN